MNYPPESDEYQMKELVNQKTPEIYKNKTILKSLISDFFPNKDIGKILKKIIEEGAGEKVYDLQKSAPNSLNLNYTKVCMEIAKSSFIPQSTVTLAINLLCIGIGIEPPQIQPETPPKPQTQPEETPQIQPEQTPQIQPEQTPQIQPEQTPQVTPKPTPQATTQVKPQPTQKPTPQATTQVKPQPTQKPTPQATPKVQPQITPQATPQVETVYVPPFTPLVPPPVKPPMNPKFPPQAKPQFKPKEETQPQNTISKDSKKSNKFVAIFICLCVLFLIFNFVFKKSDSSQTYNIEQYSSAGVVSSISSDANSFDYSEENVHQQYYNFIEELKGVIDTSDVDYNSYGLSKNLSETVGENLNNFSYGFVDLDNNGIDELLLKIVPEDLQFEGLISSVYTIHQGKIYSIMHTEAEQYLLLGNDLSLVYACFYNDKNKNIEKFILNDNSVTKVSQFLMQPRDPEKPNGPKEWYHVENKNGKFNLKNAEIVTVELLMEVYDLTENQYPIPYKPVTSITN